MFRTNWWVLFWPRPRPVLYQNFEMLWTEDSYRGNAITCSQRHKKNITWPEIIRLNGGLLWKFHDHSCNRSRVMLLSYKLRNTFTKLQKNKHNNKQTNIATENNTVMGERRGIRRSLKTVEPQWKRLRW